MTKIETLKQLWLASEKRQEAFIGWDFSYLNGRYTMEELPWRYSEIVRAYLKPEHQLLDMGTGGGELLRTFHHPFDQTAVTEGWEKNYRYLLDNLRPEGVNVQFVGEDDRLNFPDDSFDIVINSQASFDIAEVKRVLKSQGVFISQQVGDLNGITLSSKMIPGFRKERFELHLSAVVRRLKAAGFDILLADECYPAQKFYDMDGLIWYLRTIPWEFPDFSVAHNFDALLDIYEELQRKEFVYNQEHRYVFVARVDKAG